MAWTRGPRGTYSSIIVSESDINIGRKGGRRGVAPSVLRRVGGDAPEGGGGRG